MAMRTVRLDAEAEKALADIRRASGLPISEVLKQGLRTLRERIRQEPPRTPYAIFRELDIGPGGYAIGPASETRRFVSEAIGRKLDR